MADNTPTSQSRLPCDATQYFRSNHLPPQLATVSLAFAELAKRCEDILPPCPQKDLALQKLLEAKDCAVRAALKT